MRELKRSIAKANMRAEGAVRLFKRKKGRKATKSVFGLNWRNFVYSDNAYRKQIKENRARRRVSSIDMSSQKKVGEAV